MVLMYTLIGLPPPPPEAHAIKPAESRNLRAPWKNINTAAAVDESSKTKQISQHYGDVHKLAYKGCSNTLKFKAVCRVVIVGHSTAKAESWGGGLIAWTQDAKVLFREFIDDILEIDNKCDDACS